MVRILRLDLTLLYKISKNINRIQKNKIYCHKGPGDLPKAVDHNRDKFLVRAGEKVIELSNDVLSPKMCLEVKQFLKKEKYVNITNIT